MLMTGAVLLATAFGVLAAVVVARRGSPFDADVAVHHWFIGRRTGSLTAAAVVLTSTGTGVIAYGLAVAAGALGAGRRRWWPGALVGALALGGGEALRFGISLAIGRARPPRADWAHAAAGYAFPSGHTTSSAIVAALCCVALGRRAMAWHWVVLGRLLAVAWAASVGVTRVYLGVHWPTDVLGGWLLALAPALGLACSGAVLARVRPHLPAGRRTT